MVGNLQETERLVTEIYVSTFGRAPDQEGLAYWTTEVLSGNLTIEQVNQSFFDQTETQELYNGVSDNEFLNSVYQNVLGREADAAGYDYWLAGFESGEYTRDSFIQTMLNGAKAETGSSEDAALLQNKVNTGLMYAREIGVADSPLAQQIMGTVSSDSSSAEEAMGVIDFYQGWVSEYSTALGDNAEIDEAQLYQHVNDAEFWTNLEENHTLDFDTPPPVNFWEQADVFWGDVPPPPAGETPAVPQFDFLRDESMWIDPTAFNRFDGGEYAQVDEAYMFDRYAPQAANMYGDFMQHNMDANTMVGMFEGMDQAAIDGMFGALGDDAFVDIVGRTGTDGMGFLGENMANFGDRVANMDDAYVANMLGDVGADGMQFMDGMEGFDMAGMMNGMDPALMAGMMGDVGADGMQFMDGMEGFDMVGMMNGMDPALMAGMIGDVGADGMQFMNGMEGFDMAGAMNGMDPALIADFDMPYFVDGIYNPEFDPAMDGIYNPESGDYMPPPPPEGDVPPPPPEGDDAPPPPPEDATAQVVLTGVFAYDIDCM